jgi:hypothetical protein
MTSGIMNQRFLLSFKYIELSCFVGVEAEENAMYSNTVKMQNRIVNRVKRNM